MIRLASIFAGAALSAASIRAAGCLLFPRTALPYAVRFANGAVLFSGLVFALLVCGVGYPAVFVAIAVLLSAFAWRIRSANTGSLPRMHWFFAAVLVAWGVLYLIYALAPEIQPDAFGYHLRIVSEYVRLHAFSNRLTFYDVLPQGVEMLFVPAFAVGGAAGAKLVHLALLCVTIPLLREIARETGLTDRVGATSATLFFLAPVCGVAGTAAYTDAGLACATCATLYLLIRWDRERLPSLLLCASLNAGFCYAIKPTFGWVGIVGFCVVLVRGRKVVPALSFAVVTTLVITPWVVRAYVLTGDPVAPFLSAWFPNAVSTPDLEHDLTNSFAVWRPNFSWRTALLDYTVGGANQGLLGAAFLLLPLALLSLRTNAGRLLLAASALLAVPVAFNTGTRFLLPALAPASLAMAAVLPGPAALGLVALQAVSSAPPVLELYDRRHSWRLRSIPLKAALGLMQEDVYLAQSVPGFAVTKLIADNTPPGLKIFTLVSVPEAYVPRDLLLYWQSTAALRFTDALDFANMSRGTRARLLSWRWNEGTYRAVRFTARSDVRIVEARLQQAEALPQSWKNLAPGASVNLPAASCVTGTDLLIWPGDQAKEDTEGLGLSGAWESIGERAARVPHIIDLRRDSTAYIRRSGYHYILVSVAGDAFAGMGSDMVSHPFDWGIESVGHVDNMWLFHILPDLL